MSSEEAPQKGKDQTPRIVLEPKQEENYMRQCHDSNCMNLYDVRKYDTCPRCKEEEK